MMAKNQFQWTALGIIIGLVFLWFSLRDIDVSSVLDSLMTVRPWLAIMALAAGMLFMLIKAWRWSVILGPVASIELPLLHSTIYIGTAANLIIVHSGEVLRAALVGTKITCSIQCYSCIDWN
jgi:uncharacterized membrane protein YbhN (UPF0104 family)